MKKCIYHAIECNCILQQFKKMKNPPFHEFFVFSCVNDGESDNFEEKFVKCDNCGVVHHIIGISRSKILKENSSIPQTIDDIKLMLPSRLEELLSRYKLPFYVYEHVLYILENKMWGEKIVLQKEDDGANCHIKYLNFTGQNTFNVTNETFQITF